MLFADVILRSENLLIFIVKRNGTKNSYCSNCKFLEESTESKPVYKPHAHTFRDEDSWTSTWLMDSGVCYHMFHERNLVSHIEKSDQPKTVSIGDDLIMKFMYCPQLASSPSFSGEIEKRNLNRSSIFSLSVRLQSAYREPGSKASCAKSARRSPKSTALELSRPGCSYTAISRAPNGSTRKECVALCQQFSDYAIALAPWVHLKEHSSTWHAAPEMGRWWEDLRYIKWTDCIAAIYTRWRTGLS